MPSINDKGSHFRENMHFEVKLYFQKFSNFSEFSGLILFVSLAFWKLMILTSCKSYLEMISKGP